jgi:hypothetical protein
VAATSNLGPTRLGGHGICFVFIEGFDTLDDQSALGLAHQIMFTSKTPLAH